MLRWAAALRPELAARRVLSAPGRQQQAPVPALVALRERHDADDERLLLQPVPVPLSLRVRESRSLLRDGDAQPRGALQPARASHAPNARECGQPDRRSADSDGCEQERPSGEAD
jgi:hypothetical protein